jgi:hypothetical protein
VRLLEAVFLGWLRRGGWIGFAVAWGVQATPRDLIRVSASTNTSKSA